MLQAKVPDIRREVFSGSFYPSVVQELKELIGVFERDILQTTIDIPEEVISKNINGLIVPHAGWIYSGKTATIAYKILEKIKPKRVALLGPSHRKWSDRLFADGHNFWQTPLGKIEIIKDSFFETDEDIHHYEHSLEVQVPFLKYYSEGSVLLPLVVGEIGEEQAKSVANHLIEKDYFVIISTDLSHFKSMAEAEVADQQSISGIERLQLNNLIACGINPLKIAFEFCKLKNLRPQLLDYSTSAEASGDKSSVVGYASFCF